MTASVFAIGVVASSDGAAPQREPAARGASRLQFNLTPETVPTTSTEVTATPTPRVIVIPTSTPQSITIVEPAATAESSAPTAPPPSPTPTSVPPPTATVAPTLAPAQSVRLEFGAKDWRGGYYRGNGRFYGRPWAAVYGALGDYPRATLSFTLDTVPNGPATLSIAGLDDEWAESNPVALEINGQRVFEGPSPFPNWDGIGRGENAAWTTAAFAIPGGVLRPGANEITFANLSPVASFNAPPYVLLAEATLEIPAAAAEQLASSTSTSAATFTAEDWVGGYYRGDGAYYGRPWIAVYGAASEYPSASVRFRLDADPTGAATMTVAGLDDEWADLNPIAIAVNDQRIYEGPSPFANWDGVGNGANAAWTAVEITIPAEVLRSGRNEIAIANLSPAANFSAPPYILLSDATLDVPGVEVSARAGDDAQRERNRQGEARARNGDDDGDDGGDDD